MKSPLSKAATWAYRGLGVLRVLFVVLCFTLIPSLFENLRTPFTEDFASHHNPRVRGQFARMRHHLDAPKLFRGLKTEDRIHALTACTLAAQSLWSMDRAIADHKPLNDPRRIELREMIRNLADTVTQADLRLSPEVSLSKFPDAGFSAYYGPVTTVLAIHRLMTGNSRWDREIEDAANYLWRESIRMPSGLIPPLAVITAETPVFTADQSLVLYAMSLVRDLRGAPSPPLEPRWSAGNARSASPVVPLATQIPPKAKTPRKTLAKKKTPVVPQLLENPRRPWRLPVGEPSPLQVFAQGMAQNPVTKRQGLYPDGLFHEHADLSRGSGTAFLLLQFARVLPEHADQIYANFHQQMYKRGALGGGFREWPLGLDRGADASSGFIFGQRGLAATVWGLASARYFGDPMTYEAILRFTNWVGGYWEWNGERRYLLLDLPIGMMQALRPATRDRYEALHFLAEASLLRAFTHIPEVRRGGETGLYRDRRWPITEILLMILGITGFAAATHFRERLDEWLHLPKSRA